MATTPGWYKDHDDERLARWHDGNRFTEHTMVMADWQGPGSPPPPQVAQTQPAFAVAPTPPPPGRVGPSRQEARADAASAKARAKAMRPWYRKKRFIIPGILVVIIAISAIASAGGDKKNNVTSSSSQTTHASTQGTEPANTNKISADEFAAIQSGMTLAQVEEIIGGPGELLSDVNVAGQHDQVYMWDGSNASGLGANANVTFANDKVVSKAQFGLK